MPADSHGDYLWGDPIDDPLEALATSPWAQRGLVPYGGAGSQILLDTAEKAIDSGEQIAGLTGYLQRAGIRYIVVRNDLNPRQLGYTSAAQVHQTLALSGFTRVTSFGPLVAGAQPGTQSASQAASPQVGAPRYPAVEVYTRRWPRRAEPSTHPASRPDCAGQRGTRLAPAAHRAAPSRLRPARHHRRRSAADQAASRPALWAVTDGQRRADTLFGLVDSNVSYTYTADETNPPGDQFGGGAPRPGSCCRCPRPGTRRWPCCPVRPA